jgi:hypothetical protein
MVPPRVLVKLKVLKNSNMVIYEYVVIQQEWYVNGLDKGTRLYYDHTKNAYLYHYESERTNKNDKYSSIETEVIDYTLSLSNVDRGIRNGELASGPELGEFVPLINQELKVVE